jgi:hypothetical protein
MTVTAEEFLRRFLLHVLPRRFVRIRFPASLLIGAENNFCPSPSSCWEAVRGNVPRRPEVARPNRPQVGSALTAAAPCFSSRNSPLNRSAADVLSGTISLAVRSRYPVSKLQRTSARASHVCPYRCGRAPLEVKCIPSNLSTLWMRPSWPHDNQLNIRRSSRPPAPEVAKFIQYP